MQLKHHYLTALAATLALSACNIEVQIDEDDNTDFTTYLNFAEFKDVCGNFSATDVPITIYDDTGAVFDEFTYTHDGEANTIEIDVPGDTYTLAYETGVDTRTYTDLLNDETYTLTIRGDDASTCGCPSYSVTVNETNITDINQLTFSTKFGSQTGSAGTNAGEWVYHVEICPDDAIIVSAPSLGMYSYSDAGVIAADTSITLDKQLQSLAPTVDNTSLTLAHIQTNYFDANNGSYAHVQYANDAYHFVAEADYDVVQFNYRNDSMAFMQGINNNTFDLAYLSPTWVGNFQNFTSVDLTPTSIPLMPSNSSLDIELTDDGINISGDNLMDFDFIEVVATYNDDNGAFSYAEIVTMPMTNHIALDELSKFMTLDGNMGLLLFIPFDIAETNDYSTAIMRQKLGQDFTFATEGTTENGIMVAFEPQSQQ
ncbi:hypothetical protein [Catenovulum agarivorans]|uniref:hypothetical protein n=1 Tax=Catenovulum agarivorans TaxID=1172192 RepID=UPI0002F6BB89|nr:hypothetical protein [Catenovulum agarivorans]